MDTEYRPAGSTGPQDWDRCWAGEGVLVCDRYGFADQLGMCDHHYEELIHGPR